MIGREDPKENDLFFTCSLIEYIGRVTKNKRHVVVDILGRERIEKIYNLADVYHCIDIAYTAEDFIEEAGINEGDFDNISVCKYDIPTHWDIGKVFKRLILGIAREKNIDVISALFEAYHSFVEEKIEDFNSSFFYEIPENILLAFMDGSIEPNCCDNVQ